MTRASLTCFALLALLTLTVTASGCPPSEPLGAQCAVSANCPQAQICVDGSCIHDPAAPLPIGEGEGEGGKPGEGEGEGEGSHVGEGEGEGGAGGEGEGEGEGGAGGEGEGEGGGAGEGEGEGEGAPPPPTCAPACGTQQSCTATNVCSNRSGKDICDTFGTTTIDFFADQTLTINGTSGDRFFFDGQDRFYVDRLTSMRPGMVVRFNLTSSFDTVMYVFDNTNGTCAAPLFTIDQSFTNESVTLQMGIDDNDIVVTSFASIGAGTDTGTVTLQTRGILCQDGNSAGDVTDTQTAFDQCFRALFERTTSLTCASSNPCARNASDQTTGKLCTLQPNVHTPGAAITLLNDVPGGACCGASAGCPGPSCPANCL